MTRRTVLTDDPKRRVRLTDPPKPLVDIADLASALGAAEVAPAPAIGSSPVSWLAVRQEVARRLHSTGGRPG